MIQSLPLTFDLAPEPGGDTVLHVRGEVDLATAHQLRERLFAEFENHPGLIVDLSGAMLFDGAALRALHALHREAIKLGRQPPTLRGIRPLLMKAFKATGMDKLFRIEPSPPFSRPRSVQASANRVSPACGGHGRLLAGGARTPAQGLPSVA